MSLYKIMGGKEFVRRCPLLRVSGEPILKLFSARQALMEAAVNSGQRGFIDQINKTCQACSNAQRCYYNPDLKEGRRDEERVYRRARRSRGLE